uniref:Charged multivesicular body protein 4b n=1 Tax=Panagrolaimus sp. JU765 TaxID=591449 RepID=A0AC34R738_9BILA
MLSRIFGGKKDTAAASPQESIAKLRETEDMLIKKQEFFEKKIKQETDTARANASSNKRVALQALKKKKQYEKQQAHIDGVLQTIEFQRVSLENAATNAEILTVMGSAAKAMKVAHKDMDVDQVHNLMEDIAEQQDVANEIAEAISNPVGFGNDIDESDLLKELEELEEEQINEKLVNVGPAPADKLPTRLPDIPTTSLPSRSTAKKEDDDMAELEQWAHS